MLAQAYPTIFYIYTSLIPMPPPFFVLWFVIIHTLTILKVEPEFGFSLGSIYVASCIVEVNNQSTPLHKLV